MPVEIRDMRLPCKDEGAAQKFADHLAETGSPARYVDGRFVVVTVAQELWLDMIVEWAVTNDLADMEMALAAYDALQLAPNAIHEADPAGGRNGTEGGA